MTRGQIGNGSMKRLVLAAVASAIVCTSAIAEPPINSAVVHFRIWNDDSDSVTTFNNNYPSSLWIKDDVLDGDGTGGEWANRHNFRLSENGFTDARFANNDGFLFFSDVTITGPAGAEGGLEIVPWWDPDTTTGGAGGVFMAI